MNQERKKKQKQRKSQLEAMIFKMMEQSMKAALDAAMKDLFKDWKQKRRQPATRLCNPARGIVKRAAAFSVFFWKSSEKAR